MRFHIVFIFIFFSIITQVIYSKTTNCPNSYCTERDMPINYPFKLESEHPKKCTDYINLKCSQSITTINLPLSGDFYVREISYYSKAIYLYDPIDCLPGKLLNLSLASTPFYSIKYENYTFYNCPMSLRLIQDGFKPIDCLSTNPNATIATSQNPPEVMIRTFGCTIITTARLPVTYIGQLERTGIFDHFQLQWDIPACQYCDGHGPIDHESKSKLGKFIRSPIFIFMVSILGLGFSIYCFDWLWKCTAKNEEATNTTTVNANEGLIGMTGTTTVVIDESKFKSYTMSTFLLENPGVLGPDKGITCAICLEEYSPQNTIKCIVLCQHYFHADCIDLWWKKNSTCPICRTLL